MRYTASHEVVHFIKENSPEHYAALEELVLKELTKGGMSKMLQATSSMSEAVDTYLSTVPEGTEKPEKYFVDILKQMDERISFWKAEKSKTKIIFCFDNRLDK